MADQKKTGNERTFDHQSSLPPLTVPKLEDTCRKYLESVRPFLTEEQFLETEHKTGSFEKGIGRLLQTKLEYFALHTKNWIADLWYKAYFNFRGTLPVLSNFGGGQPPSGGRYFTPEKGSQYRRAALWIYFLVQDFLKIIHQEYPVQKLGRKYPMDMIQYLDLFCAGRIPGEYEDVISHHINYLPKKDGTMEVMCNVQHVLILMQNRIFKLNVFDSRGNVLLPPSLENQLLKIVDVCKLEGNGTAIGTLTAANRDVYYKAYRHLCALDKQNKVNIDIINQAIVAFAFDDLDVYDLHGSVEQGFLGSCDNRWFDKPFTAIISSTGIIASNHDHVHYDGFVSSDVAKNIRDSTVQINCKWSKDYVPQKMTEPVELRFIIDDNILQTIKDVTVNHNENRQKISIVDKPIEGFGKSFSKCHRINPDTLVQMAIQLAYYRLKGTCVATYESATTRVFYHGRTETVRSCTSASKAWVEAMMLDIYSTSTLKLFWDAVKIHDKLREDAMMGKGIDRHLFALKKFAEMEGIVEPSIFVDEGWKLSGGDGNFTLSTSLSGFHDVHGALSPMCQDGYGVFYTIDNDFVFAAVSAWTDCVETNALVFYNSLIVALNSIRNMLRIKAKM